MGERRKTSSAIYKNILPPVKEHLDEGRRSSRGAARFGFRKAVSVTLVFLVVTQFNVRGKEVEGRGDALPAWLKIKKSERGGREGNYPKTTTTSWSLFAMPGICPAAPGG